MSVRLEVHTTRTVKITFVWGVAPYSLVDRC
jgi:hypothetical protein